MYIMIIESSITQDTVFSVFQYMDEREYAFKFLYNKNTLL
jgi:hypothetical protein